MTSPTNTAGLEVVDFAQVRRELDYADRRGGLGLDTHEFIRDAIQLIDQSGTLVTAASAQARIAELEERVGQLQADFDDCNLHRAAAVTRATAAEARADRLAGALDALQDLFAREGECSLERFERIAEMFRKDTGYLAPGKDPGMLSQQPEGDELRRIYDDWFSAKIATARAALQQEPTT
jgi:hypothetical protein